MSGSGPEWCKLPEDLVKYLETGTLLGANMFFLLQVGSRFLGIYDGVIWCYLDFQFSTLMSILHAYYHYVIIKGKRDQLGIGRLAFKPLYKDPRLFFFFGIK